MELLNIFDMQIWPDHRQGSLPYGAQRRLEIVRALAPIPRCCCLTSRLPA